MKGTVDDYVVAVVGALTVIGLVEADTMSPVYQFNAGQGPTERGYTRIWQVLPFLGSCEISSLTLPAGTLAIPVKDFSRDEKKKIEQGIRNCEELLRGLRASEAGITIAPANWKPSAGV